MVIMEMAIHLQGDPSIDEANSRPSCSHTLHSILFRRYDRHDLLLLKDRFQSSSNKTQLGTAQQYNKIDTFRDRSICR